MMVIVNGEGYIGLNLYLDIFFTADFNIFFGIGEYSYFSYSDLGYSFTISYNATTFSARFNGPLSYNGMRSRYFAYSLAIFPYFECNKRYFIYNQTENLCYDSCANDSFYIDLSTRTCQACPLFCLTCYSDSSCKTCESGTNRKLVNYKCIPIDGYYDTNSNVAAECDDTCVTCFGNATNCTKCPNANDIVLNNTCQSCNNLLEGCSTCNLTTCFSCNSSYFFVNSSYCNLPCRSFACKVCSNTNTSFCF